MTLDELLAYLPDNSTGAIDASDLRAVVTGLFDMVTELEASIQAIQVGDSGGTTISLTGIWQVNPQAGTDPGGAQVTQDTGVLDTATWLRFAYADKNDVVLTNALLAATTIYVQNQQDASRWVKYTVDSTADSGTYVQVDVTVADSGGTAGSAGWQNAIVVLGGIPT